MPSILPPDSASAPLAPSPHIPAWKRLGLKLKFAKESPEPETVSTTPETPKQGKREKKRKREEVAAPAAEIKKAKTASSTNTAASKPSIFKSPPPSSPRRRHLSKSADEQPTPKPSSLKRQKSVTFTPDTKAKDGESVKQLFKSWVDEQKAADASFDPESVGAALQSPVAPVVIATTEEDVANHTSLSETQPKGKREKKRKRPEPASTDSTPYIAPHLVYLEQHHSSRSAWKFNKAKQSHLLKHLFDFTQIPAEYELALSGYMAGLQGEAVRARVVAAANRVLTEDRKVDAAPQVNEGGSSEMADRDRIRKAAEYHDALQTHVQAVRSQLSATPPDPAGLSPSMRQRVRKRAETILLSLAQSAPPSTTRATRAAEADRPAATTKRIKLDPSSSSQPSPQLEPPAQGRRRNRKQRTNRVSDETSSDDDTSSSGSSETDSSSSSEGESTSDSGSESGPDDSEDSGSADEGAEDEGPETSSSSSSSSGSGGDEGRGR